MLLKTKKLLMIVTIISMMIVGESLIASAKQYHFDKEATPDLFHIGTFNLEINVSQTDFSPATFTVIESATVNLSISSIDIGHTFEIPEYGIDEEITANTTIYVEFTADKIGSFTYSSVNCSATGTMTVEDPYVPTLPRPEEIDILVDITHHSNKSRIHDIYSTMFDWLEDNNFNVIYNEVDRLIDQTLEGQELIIILEPDEDLEEEEISNLINYIRTGGGLLIGGSPNTANTTAYELIQPFGFKFTNSTARYINSTDLIDPIGENNTLPAFFVSQFIDHPIFIENQYVPLTDEIVSIVNYVGSTLEYNETWIVEGLNESDLLYSGELVDSYALMRGNETIFADINANGTVDENETIGSENILIGAAETIANGRMIALSAADIFNNTQMGRYPENEVFYQRIVQWLTKMYAVIENHDFAVESLKIKKGDTFQVTSKFTVQNNTPIDAINVTTRIWRLSNLKGNINSTALNQTDFEAEIDTTSISLGTIYVNVVAHLQGYGYNVTKSIYIEINPANANPLKVAIPYILTYSVSILVGVAALSFFFTKAIKAPKEQVDTTETTTETIDQQEEEETEEEIDLDEYEVEEETEE